MSWREILLALGGKERKGGGENEMPWFVRVNMLLDVVGATLLFFWFVGE